MSPRTMLLHNPLSTTSHFLGRTRISSCANSFTSRVLAAPLVRHAGTESTPSNTSSASPPPPPAPTRTSSKPQQSTTNIPDTRPPGKFSLKTGTVVSAGRMDKTVRVQYKHTVWDKHLRKHYPAKTNFMVHDPRNSLREGDVIEFASGWRTSKTVRHVVERIIAPFGIGVDERPPVMSREEREEDRREKHGEVRMGKVKKRVLERLFAEKA